jgi:hypothetical protein
MAPRGAEINYGTRAVIAYSGLKRKPLSVIKQELSRPKKTCRDIRRHAIKRAKRTKLPIFHKVNVTPYYRNGRPKALSERQVNILILQATMNKQQRAKS